MLAGALGRRLATYRRVAGHSQVDLASHAGYSRSTVANVETGRQNVPRGFWQRCDETLAANGALLAAFDDLGALICRRREDVTRFIEAERAAKARVCKREEDSLAVGGSELELLVDRDSSAVCEGLWDATRTVKDIGRLTTGDLVLGRRDATKLLGNLLVGAALTEPLEPWVHARSLVRGRMPALGDEEVRRIEASAGTLRHWEDRLHQGIRRKAVIGQLNEVAELVEDGQPPAISRRLFVVVSELAAVAADMSYDAGLHASAQRYYLLALRASHQTGDRLFGANVLADMARQLLDLDHPGDALQLVHMALQGVEGEAPGRVVAMLRTREAWAHGELNKVQAFHRSVAQAEESLAGARDDEQRPYWIDGFDEAELAGVVGARYRDLARHQPARSGLARRAVEHISRALELRDPRKLRNRAFDTIGLGRAYLVMGEPEQACRVTDPGLDLSAMIGSGRVDRRLAHFFRESALYEKNRAVADFRAKVRQQLQPAAW